MRQILQEEVPNYSIQQNKDDLIGCRYNTYNSFKIRGVCISIMLCNVLWLIFCHHLYSLKVPYVQSSRRGVDNATGNLTNSFISNEWKFYRAIRLRENGAINKFWEATQREGKGPTTLGGAKNTAHVPCPARTDRPAAHRSYLLQPTTQ